MPVVDAHLHLWDVERGHYLWLPPGHPLTRTWTAEEAAPLLQAVGVDAAVLVQAEDSYADTAAMLVVADAHPWVAGVVGWVPLSKPAEARNALERFAADRRFRGVRHLNHDEADPAWLLRPGVDESLVLLAERDLTLDVVAVIPEHLDVVPVLAERHPSLRIVVDHLGKPPIAVRGWEPWAGKLAAAAEAPNVHAKLSGLGTAADPETWSAADLQPYVDHALQHFGASRLLYGGDWPVATLAGDHVRTHEETLKALGGLTFAERDRVMGGTAVEVYGLELA